MKRISETASIVSGEQNVRNACATLDAVAAVLNGLAVGIFARSPLEESAKRVKPDVAARFVTQPQPAASTRNHDLACTCSNCGKQMKLSDTVNFYGLPACPVCLDAAEPFEVVVEASEIRPAQSRFGIQANA
jgi:hypothetical protein